MSSSPSIIVALALALPSLVLAQARPHLGIWGSETPADDGKPGVEIRDVEPGGPADQGGLRPGDRITALGETLVNNFDELKKAVSNHKPGDAVTFQITRDNADQNVTVTLGEAPIRPDRQRGPFGPEVGDMPDIFTPQPMIGLRLQPIDDEMAKQLNLPQAAGLLVADVLEGGPADKAGVRVDDVVMAFEGNAIGSPEQLRDAIRGKKKGDSVTLNILRQGQNQDIAVTVDVRSAAFSAPADPSNGDTLFRDTLERLQQQVGSLEERVRTNASQTLDEVGKRLEKWESQAQMRDTEQLKALQERVANLEKSIDQRIESALKRLEDRLGERLKSSGESPADVELPKP
jgi:C-terminal processing protease CtpA/Prc